MYKLEKDGYRRYAIVAESDLRDAGTKLAQRWERQRERLSVTIQ